MKRFLATAVFCLALVPSGAFAFHTIFPDGNVMTQALTAMPPPAPAPPPPFASCNPSLSWARLLVVDVNNLSTLGPVHVRAYGNCLDIAGTIVLWYLTDYYGPAAPTITDTGADYSVVWAVQQNVGGVWSPFGTFTLSVPKTSLH